MRELLNFKLFNTLRAMGNCTSPRVIFLGNTNIKSGLPYVYLFLSLFICQISFGQIFIEDFDGSNTTVTTTFSQNCNDGVDDYFDVVCLNGTGCGNEVGASISLAGASGFFLGAHDTDGSPCNSGSVESFNLTGINVGGQTSLVICIDVAEDDDGANNDWDPNSQMVLTTSIDGGTSETLFDIQAMGSGNDQEPGFDCDGDGVGDGDAITSTFTTYCAPVTATGTSMDISITVRNLTAGQEDIAIDNIAVYSATNAAPNSNNGCVPPVAPPSISISDPCNCLNGIDLNGDDINDLALETITIIAATGQTITLTTAGGLVASNGTTAASGIATDNGTGTYTFSAYVPANGTTTYSATFTVSGGGVNDGQMVSISGGACMVCPFGVPTLGEWGLITLALLILTIGMLFLTVPTMATTQGQQVSFPLIWNNLPFYKKLYFQILPIVALAVLGFFTIIATWFGYEWTSADPLGILVTVPLMSYMLMMVIHAELE